MACDVCSQNGFRVTRITCLDCSKDGWSTLDLCANCSDRDCVRDMDNKRHSATHPLLQVRKVFSQRMMYTLFDSADAKLEAMNTTSYAPDEFLSAQTLSAPANDKTTEEESRERDDFEPTSAVSEAGKAFQ